MRRRHRAHEALAAALAIALLAACTDGVSAYARSQDLNPRTDRTISLAGTAGAPLTLTVAPGDLAGDGTVTATPSKVPPPKRVGFTPAGDVAEIALIAELASPVTIRFGTGDEHAGAVPVIWRHDPKSG
jgi:hypothetical protein